MFRSSNKFTRESNRFLAINIVTDLLFAVFIPVRISIVFTSSTNKSTGSYAVEVANETPTKGSYPWYSWARVIVRLTLVYPIYRY